MTKTDRHRSDLVPLVEACLTSGRREPLFDYIRRNSNLPGPRGNLELAGGFGDAIAAVADAHAQDCWRLCMDMVAYGDDVAPVDSPSVMVCFCGTVGIGALAGQSASHLPRVYDVLQTLACDGRWRVREAVCFAIQRLLGSRAEATTRALEQWVVVSGTPLEMRAVVAGLAHPPALKNEGLARQAIRLHRLVCDRVMSSSNRKDEGFRVLRKGLAFTLSVVTAALPEDGFALLSELIETGDDDLIWVVRQNLRKNRLTRAYPDRVRSLSDRLSSPS